MIITLLTLYSSNRAYKLFAKASDMGNLKAMEKMADALLFGNFGMQNITAAIQLYESLAKEGSILLTCQVKSGSVGLGAGPKRLHF